MLSTGMQDAINNQIAREFYAREGFRDCSEAFVEAGIDHVEMEKRLR